MRWVIWLLCGLLLGGIVHLATILLLPRTATQDAFARLLPVTETNKVALLPAPSPEGALLPFTDPAFSAAVCRYDLSNGPLKLQTPVGQSYTSVSFYTRQGIAYYAINDRAAGRRTIELDLMTAQQRSQIQEDEEVTAADRLIVESPTPTGLILLRGLAAEPSAMASVRRVLNAARCEPPSPS
jgi:uncharacterized membrane protein